MSEQTPNLKILKFEREIAPNVLEAAEHLLALVQAGEVRAVAIVFERSDGDAGHHIAVDKGAHAALLVGGMEIAKAAVMGMRTS